MDLTVQRLDESPGLPKRRSPDAVGYDRFTDEPTMPRRGAQTGIDTCFEQETADANRSGRDRPVAIKGADHKLSGNSRSRKMWV